MLPLCDRVVCVSRAKYLPSRCRGISVPKDPTTIGGHLRRCRLELKLFQSQVAKKLGVSTRTLSLWECDKVYPVWEYQPKLAEYLGFDPFTNPALGSPKSNKPFDVASLASNATGELAHQLHSTRVLLKKSRRQFAKILGICPKTIWGWETKRRTPSPMLQERVETLLKSLLSSPQRSV